MTRLAAKHLKVPEEAGSPVLGVKAARNFIF